MNKFLISDQSRKRTYNRVRNGFHFANKKKFNLINCSKRKNIQLSQVAVASYDEWKCKTVKLLYKKW